MLNIFAVIAIIFSSVLSIVVLVKNSRPKANRAFILICFLFAVWMLANYFVNYLDITPSVGLFFSRMSLPAAALIFYLFLYFSWVYPKEEKFLPNYYWYLFFVPVLIVIILFNTDMNLALGFSGDGSYILVPGILYDYFSVYAVITLVMGIYILFKKYFSLRGMEQLQVRIVFTSFIFTIICSIATEIYLLKTGASRSLPITTLFSFIFLGATSYSILVHHLFDIRIIIKKTIVYSALLMFVLAAYVFIVAFSTAIFGINNNINCRTLIPSIISAAFIALGYDPLKSWLGRVTDRWLYKGEYDTKLTLTKLSDGLNSIVDLNDAVVFMMKSISDAMRINKTIVVVTKSNNYEKEPGEKLLANTLDDISHLKFMGYKISERKLRELCAPIVAYFKSNNFKKPILVEDFRKKDLTADEKALIESCKYLEIEIVMPISTKDSIIGFFILGEKKSGDLFSERDMNLLNIAVNQTASAIEKARFYELDQTKSEFVSIASHELLTPICAMDGFLSMIIDEHLAKVDKKAEGFLNIVYDSTKRLQVLIKDLLEVSRIEDNRIVIKWQAFDIVPLVNETIKKLGVFAKNKKISVKFSGVNYDDNESMREFYANKICVYADKERVAHVLENIISNAIKFTDKGHVQIELGFNSIKLVDEDLKNGYLEIAVKDTGIGICAEEQKHLFEKFFRTSNVTSAGVGGTGLGLYISKNLVDLMEGMIFVNSKINSGSTFYINLKLATKSQIKYESADPEGAGLIPLKPDKKIT